MEVFPEGYPEDLLERILNAGGGFNEMHVYRVAAYGLDDKKSFLSSYQEEITGLAVWRPKPLDTSRISAYSTSCSQSLEDMQRFLKVCFRQRKQPNAEIVVGITKSDCGPSKLNPKNRHVDWWLYLNSTPWVYFTRLEV